MEREDLKISEVANICGCHFNTVKNYTDKGFIQAARDNNGFRRYSLQEALKLKAILSIRRRVEHE